MGQSRHLEHKSCPQIRLDGRSSTLTERTTRAAVHGPPRSKRGRWSHSALWSHATGTEWTALLLGAAHPAEAASVPAAEPTEHPRGGIPRAKNVDSSADSKESEAGRTALNEDNPRTVREFVSMRGNGVRKGAGPALGTADFVSDNLPGACQNRGHTGGKAATGGTWGSESWGKAADHDHDRFLGKRVTWASGKAGLSVPFGNESRGTVAV